MEAQFIEGYQYQFWIKCQFFIDKNLFLAYKSTAFSFSWIFVNQRWLSGRGLSRLSHE